MSTKLELETKLAEMATELGGVNGFNYLSVCKVLQKLVDVVQEMVKDRPTYKARECIRIDSAPATDTRAAALDDLAKQIRVQGRTVTFIGWPDSIAFGVSCHMSDESLETSLQKWLRESVRRLLEKEWDKGYDAGKKDEAGKCRPLSPPEGSLLVAEKGPLPATPENPKHAYKELRERQAARKLQMQKLAAMPQGWFGKMLCEAAHDVDGLIGVVEYLLDLAAKEAFAKEDAAIATSHESPDVQKIVEEAIIATGDFSITIDLKGTGYTFPTQCRAQDVLHGLRQVVGNLLRREIRKARSAGNQAEWRAGIRPGE
jgi:hypothetical protein